MFEHALPGWSRVNLTDLATYINGYAFKPEDWSEHGLPIVRIAQITGSSADCDYYQGRLSEDVKIDNGDIIFSWSGTLCVVQWNGGPAWLNQHLFKVKPAEGVSHRLLYHILSHAVAEMDKSAHGSTMKHIKRSELKRYEFLFPNGRKEQEKIGRVLDTLDTQIQKTEALIAKLEKVKEGLLHDLLTRGIDENGQLRPSPEQAPELYKDSPFGSIPREWGETRISSVSYHIVDCPHSTPEYLDEGVLVARTTQIKGGKFDFSSASRVSEKEYRTRIARLEPMPGDIVFTREAPVGEAFIIPEGIRMCLGQRVMLIRLDRCVASPDFIVAHIYSGQLRDRIQTLTAGTTNPHLNVSEVGELMIPLPPVSEQESMASVWRSYLNRISEEKNIADQLRSLKSGLMDDLLTGRVRVTPLLDKAQAQATTPA